MLQGFRAIRRLFTSLGRTPAYGVTTTLVLALGIGVGVAAVAIGQRALLEPLPYREPNRLVVVQERSADGDRRLPSYPTARDWAAGSDVLSGLAYVTGTQVLFRETLGSQLVLVAYPVGPFFELMGGRPILGRVFGADEQGSEPVVVLSYAFWKTRFGGRPDIVGEHIPLGDGATVIGVMPRGFQFPEWAQTWMPIAAAPPSLRTMVEQRTNHADSRLVARLAEGVTREQAQARLGVVARHVADEHPEQGRGWTSVSFTSMPEYAVSFTTAGAGMNLVPRIGLLIGAAMLILLLGCANVAVLGLLRGFGRARELAIRSALGATPGRIVRHLLTESLTLAAGGGVIGLAFGTVLVRTVQRWDPALFPRLAEVEFDRTFVMAALCLALAVGLASGLIPAVRATSLRVSTLVGGTRGEVGAGRAGRRLQQVLIGSQVAVAVMLTVGAGLLIRSLREVAATPVGVDIDHLSVITIVPSEERYSTGPQMEQLYRGLLDAVRRVPGVLGVAFINHAPLGGASMPTRVVVEGREPTPDEPDRANFKTISPDYFEIAGIPVLRGRTFDPADFAEPTGSLVVNRSLAERYWPGQDPVGKPLTVFKSARWLPDFGEPIRGTVIGVVGDVRSFNQEAAPVAEVFVPYTWDVWQWGSLVVKSDVPPGALREPIRQAVIAVDPDLPIGTGNALTSFDSRLAALRAPRRLMTAGLSLLAVAAMAITMVGLYATLAYGVRRRRAEVGVRMALGARRAEVSSMILREGVGVVLPGLAAGLVMAGAAANLLASFVFGITPRDPGVFVSAAIPIVFVAVLATYVPARQAARVDPAEALRD